MKPLVHEHCKRLLINLVVVLVCRGERSTVAKALLDFQSVSNIALDRSISVKGSINVIAEEGSLVDEQGISDAENLHRYENMPEKAEVLKSKLKWDSGSPWSTTLQAGYYRGFNSLLIAIKGYET